MRKNDPQSRGSDPSSDASGQLNSGPISAGMELVEERAGERMMESKRCVEEGTKLQVMCKRQRP